MLFRDKARKLRKAAAVFASVTVLAVCTATCSKSSSPALPDDPQGRYLGTWTGIVTNDVIGSGSATVVFDDGFKSPSIVQVTGHWSFVFPDARFSATGTVSASRLTDGTLFVLIFSPSAVPCPDEANGVSVRTRAASLTFTANRMQGSYISGGCPGGMIDLTRN